ncbi:hypothetical protein [Pelistega sp. MC2]|uniref:hypothetical protein n=1 Tax=Pelistega sp. MC2 TaxID=1720297 RepID=UPI0008DA36F3|nr:hypothetical protein [Pelistega sp. MC2]
MELLQKYTEKLNTWLMPKPLEINKKDVIILDTKNGAIRLNYANKEVQEKISKQIKTLAKIRMK